MLVPLPSQSVIAEPPAPALRRNSEIENGVFDETSPSHRVIQTGGGGLSSAEENEADPRDLHSAIATPRSARLDTNASSAVASSSMVTCESGAPSASGVGVAASQSVPNMAAVGTMLRLQVSTDAGI